MTNLTELAEAVEGASEPDRVLDWRIHLRDGLEGVGAFGAHPAYTASLDCAMSLVPEGYHWTLGNHVFGDLNKWRGFVGCYPADAATPALALCAAALRARAAVTGAEQ